MKSAHSQPRNLTQVFTVSFSFSVDSAGISVTNLNSMISVQPKKGSLTTTEKPTNVQVFFCAKKEVRIEQQPILRCQVRGPNVGNQCRQSYGLPAEKKGCDPVHAPGGKGQQIRHTGSIAGGWVKWRRTKSSEIEQERKYAQSLEAA